MNALDFLPLEKAVGADTVNDLAQVLGVNRRHVMHWRSVGLTEDEARDLAAKAELDPGDVWPELGGQPAKAAPAAESGIVWCDPPESGGRQGGSRGRWLLLLAPLKERPGEWARVSVSDSPKKAQNSVSGLRQAARSEAGRQAGGIHIPAGRWEFAARPLPEDTTKGGVWARYLGDAE